MDLEHPIALRLTVDAGHSPLRGVLERSGQPATEFRGMLQLLEVLERLTGADQVDPTPLTRKNQ